MIATHTMGSDPLEHIADRCREELAKYRETGNNDQQPCLDLWRMALREQSNRAWQHIIVCFTPYLKGKLTHDHTGLAREILRRRSHSATPAQAEQSLIHDGFAELAKGNLRHPLEIRDLAGLLRYLWMCLQNLMRMEMRPPVVDRIPEDDDVRGPGDFPPQLTLEEAAAALRGCARNDREHRAGVLLIFLQYMPKELATDKRYQREFADVQELYLIKARLLKCIREHVEWP